MSYNFIYPSDYTGKQRKQFALTPKKPSVQMRRDFNDYMFNYNYRIVELEKSLENKQNHERVKEFVDTLTDETIKMAVFITDTTGFTQEEIDFLNSDTDSEFWAIQDYEKIAEFTNNFRDKFGFTRG